MVEVHIKKDFIGDIYRVVEERIVNTIKDIIKFTDTEEMIHNVNKWYDSCSSNLEYTKSNGSFSYINTSDVYGMYSRKFVYESLINYLENHRGLQKYSVAIPAGNGEYITLARSCTGSLIIGEKRYRNIEVLKRHNSQVPGGITIEEVESSDLGWCLPFMEKMDE